MQNAFKSFFAHGTGPEWCRQTKWGDPQTVGIGFELGQSSKDCELEMLIIIWGFPHFSMTDKEVVIEAAIEAVVPRTAFLKQVNSPAF